MEEKKMRKERASVKRILAAILCIVVVCTGLPMISYGREQDQIFESFQSWTFESSGKDTFAMADGVSGNAAQIVKAGKEASTLTSDAVMVTAGKKYKAGVSVKSPDGKASLSVLAYEDAEGKKQVGEETVIGSLENAADFTEISGDYTVPGKAGFVKLVITFGDGTSSDGEVYVADNAYLYAYSSAAGLSDGYQMDGAWYRNGWSNGGSTTHYANTVDAGYLEDGALYFHNTSTEGDMPVCISVGGVTAGTYTLSLYLKGKTTYAGEFRFLEGGHDSDLVKITDVTEYADWTKVEKDFTVHGDGGSSVFYLYFGQYNWAADLYVDNVTLINKETGVDLLAGAGSFYNPDGVTLTTQNLVVNAGFEDVIYNYLPISKFNGTLEGAELIQHEMDWTLIDNATGDVLSLASADASHGKAAMVTKGDSAQAGQGWVTFSSPMLDIQQGGSYCISFDAKGEGTSPYFVISGYWFNANGNVVGDFKTTEGALSTDWSRKAGSITAPAEASKAQVRIVCWGAAGDKLYFDNIAVNPWKTETYWAQDSWNYGGFYANPDESGVSQISLVEDGYLNPGSLHMVQNYAQCAGTGKSISIGQLVKNWESKTYIFSAWIKGNTQNAGDPTWIELPWGLGTWADTGNAYRKLEVNSDNWTKVEYEFTVTTPQWAPIHIYSSQYTGADYYIDNISIYAKDNAAKTNLLSDGDFCKVLDEADTSVNLITNGGFEGLETFVLPGWNVTGNVSYSDEKKAVVLEPGAFITSLRYDVKGKDIYQYSLSGRQGSLTFTFDDGIPYTVKADKGYVEVPAGASYMRVVYKADDTQAELYGITLTEYEDYTNFNFEVPKFGGAQPYHWTGYHVAEPQSGVDYKMSWVSDGGINGSGAMKVTAQRNNENSYVVYSVRTKVEPSMVYNLSFWGNYQGKDITVVPLIRMYKEDGSETTQASSYNWCNDALSKDNSGKWKTHSANFTTSADAAYIEVRWEIAGHTAGDTALFDEVVVSKVGKMDDPNLDFEAGTPESGVLNWTGYHTYDLTATDYQLLLAEGEGVGGSNAMKVVTVKNNKGVYVIYSIRLTAEPSMVYNLSFDGKYQGRNITVAPFIRMYKEDGSETTLASSYNWCDDPLSQDNTNTWKRHSANFTTSADTAYIEVRFDVTGPRAGSTAWFDNVQLKKIASSDDLNLDFEIGADESGVFGWNGYHVANLTANDYEMSIARGQGVDGSNAMQILTIKENKDSFVTYSGRMKVDASGVYSLTFWGNYTGTDLKCSPLIRQYKADGSETTSASSYIWLTSAASTDNSGAWKTYTANFSTSEDAAYIEVRFEVAGPHVGTKFLFDDIAVTKLGEARDANWDFETGENGKAVFNWNTYERRETSAGAEEGNFGAYTSYKADGASGDGSAAAVIKKLNTENIDYYFQSSIVEVSPDTDYAFEYDVMIRNSKKNVVRIYIRQYKNVIGEGVANELEAHTWLTDAYTYGSCDWKRVGATFRTAADAKYVSVFFAFGGTEQSTTFLDNVSLTKTKEISDPNFDFEYTAAGKPVNWSSVTASGIAEVTADSSVYYRGNKSLHLVKKYSEINYTTVSMQKKLKVSAGDSIEFVVHMRSKDSVAGRFAAVIQGYNAEGNFMGANHGQDRVLNTTGKLSEWDTYRISFKIPKNWDSVALSLRVGGKEADVYFDAIEYYNYTQNDNLVYEETFAGPDSDGMFGGWKSEETKGAPSFGTRGSASITGKNDDNGMIYTDVDVLGTDYTYSVKANYRSSGSATGRIVIDAIDWRGRTISSVVTQEIKEGDSANLETSFTAVSATLYRVRVEKTGGDGTISMDNLGIWQIAEPVRSTGWEGKWVIWPADYDAILSNEHNERYYYYRQELYVEDDVKKAQIQITADDRYKLYVNGKEVYEETGTGDTWAMPGNFDLTEYMQKGKNVIAVRLYNDTYAYGLLYDGIIKMNNDSTLRFYSDENLMIARETGDWSEEDSQQFMLPDYDMDSCKVWTKAEVYCPVGEGPWGVISFDNTEYSDYKLESNEFTFPKDAVEAGETVKVKAKIKIEEQLPASNEFDVFFWKRNTTKKICGGTLILADGKSTEDWPVGKEFTAEFELKIPEFLATGSYTIQFDDLVAVVSDKYVGNKVGNVKVTQPSSGVTTKTEIKLENGKPTYLVNGIPTTSLWYGRAENDTAYRAETVTKAGAAGVETVICYICLSGTYGEVWKADGTIDATPIDQQILGTLSANPEAYLQVAIDTTPPDWWLEQNPEECVKLSNGKLSKQTYASTKWRQECSEIMKKVLDYLMEQPYANNIAGIKLTGGTTYEWQWWGMNGNTTEVGDFSSAGLNAFREWLKENYETNEALQKSWKKSSVTFDTAEVPTIEARSQSEYLSVLSVQDSRAAIDYQRFMTDMQTDSILYFADLVKEHLNGRLVVGTYAGYLQNCGTYEFATTTAQAGLDRLLRSDSLDWVQTPWLYGEREIGNMTDYMGAIDSVTAHGKLLIVEEDSRMNLSYIGLTQDANASVGWTRTTKESVEVLKRNFCYVLSKGQSLDFYDMGGRYFDDDQFYGLMAQMSQESTLSMGLERKSTSEVAVFMDSAMSQYFAYSKTPITDELLFKSVLNKQREELQNIGAPYDTYLLDDLVDGLVPEHKVNIMLSTTQITEEEREAIEKQLKKDNNIILWVFLTGITDGNKTDVSLMSDVVGMNLKQLNVQSDNGRKFMGTAEVTNYSHWLTEGLSDVTYGAIEYATLAPVITVNDGKATTIAVHEGTGLDGTYAGLAVKEITNADGSKWTSIYSAVPTVPTALIRNMMKHTGCHIYDESSSDIVFADSNYVAVHSLFAGEHKISLPGTYTVYDVFNREIVAESASEITYTAEGAETRLFRLSEPETVQCYVTHNVGGSSSTEGLVTMKPGEDLKFDFAAEEGYSVNYLMVDGEKVVPEGNSYSIEDVKESHTVIVKFAKAKKKEIDEKTPEEVKKKFPMALLIGIAAAVLVIIAAVVILLVYKKKRKKAQTENEKK